jgi:hypothetical protein
MNSLVYFFSMSFLRFLVVGLSVGLCVVQDCLLARGKYSFGTGEVSEWAMLVPDCIVLSLFAFAFLLLFSYMLY